MATYTEGRALAGAPALWMLASTLIPELWIRYVRVPAKISAVDSVDARTETGESVPAALEQPKSLSGDKG